MDDNDDDDRTPWRFRLGFYRCLVCVRPWVLHSPARRRLCDNAPLNVTVTGPGLEVAELDIDWPRPSRPVYDQTTDTDDAAA